MKKKLLSLILVASFIIGMMSVPSIAQGNDDSETADYIEAANVMNALGFSPVYTEDEIVKRRITRGEFVTEIASMLGFEAETSAAGQIFSDVPSSHDAYNAVGFAYSLGLISGNGGTFEPDNPITLEQACKIIVLALGYRGQAENAGGYPHGYIAIAGRLKVTDGVFGVGNMLLRMGTAQKLLYNALDVDLIYDAEYTSDSHIGYLTLGKNILNTYHGITKGKGIVTATPVSGLTGYMGTNEKTVKINNVEYIIGKTSVVDLLGHAVIWYANSDSELLYIHRDRKRSEALEANIRDIQPDSFNKDGESFSYKQDEKIRKVTVSPYADYLYNGVSTGSFKPELLKGEGYVSFIDSNNDLVYDVVAINAAETVVVENVDKNTGKIFDRYDVTKVIDTLDSDRERFSEIYFENVKISLGAVQKGDILSVFRSVNEDGVQNVRVIVSRSSVVGKLTSYIDDDTVEINGTEYIISPGLAEKLKPIQLGSTGTFGINIFGSIADFKKSTDSEYNTFLYGYLIKAGTTGNLGDSLEVKLLTASNAVGVFSCSDKIKIDGFRPSSAKDALSQLTQDSGKTGQVVRYKMNEKNVVTELDTVLSGPRNGNVRYDASYGIREEGEDALSYDVPITTTEAEKRRWISTASSFGLQNVDFIVDSEITKILVVPENEESAEDGDYRFVTRTHFVSSRYYHVEAYNLSEVKFADLVVNRVSTPDIYDSEHIALVASIVSAKNADGEWTKKIKMVYRNAFVEHFTETEALADNIKQGDVIRFAKNHKDEISTIQKIYNEDSDFGLVADGSGTGYFYANMNAYFGVIHKKEGYGVIFSTSTDVDETVFHVPFHVASAKYAVYSKAEKEVKIISAEEFENYLYPRNPDARIVVGAYGGRAEEIFILDLN